MKPTLLTILGLLLLLSVPSVDASFTDNRQWHAYATSFTDTNGVVSATSFTLHDVPHGYTVTGRISLVEVSVAFTTTPASPATIDDYVATLVIKEGATTRITCDGMSFSRANIPDTGRIQFSFLSFCHGTGANALVPGTTYTYETSVTMVTGTNKIVNSGWSFKVENTDIITDASLDTLATTSGQLIQHQATRTLINTTSATTQGLVTGHNATMVGQHTVQGLYSHCEQTVSTVNDCEGIKAEFTEGFAENSTCVECFSQMGIIDLPGFDDGQTGGFLLFIAFLLFAFFQRWLFVAIASIIGILELVLLGEVFGANGFTFTMLLLVLSIVLQILVDHRDAIQEKRAKEEGGEIGD